MPSLDELVVSPNALVLLLTFREGHDSETFLLSVFPLALVCYTIWPSLGAEAIWEMILPLTCIRDCTLPSVGSKTVPLVFLELAHILAAVAPLILSET